MRPQIHTLWSLLIKEKVRRSFHEGFHVEKSTLYIVCSSAAIKVKGLSIHFLNDESVYPIQKLLSFPVFGKRFLLVFWFLSSS